MFVDFQDMRTPQRNESGVDLLIEYFNQLHFIERRFFPPDRVLGAHFHWYVKQHVKYRYLSVYKKLLLQHVKCRYLSVYKTIVRETAEGFEPRSSF